MLRGENHCRLAQLRVSPMIGERSALCAARCDGMRELPMTNKTHWEQVYQSKPSDTVSWYQPHSEKSLALIRGIAGASVVDLIDVGAGASSLVDDVLSEGLAAVTVLDISATALAQVQQRLRERARAVRWIEADVTQASLPSSAFDIWHDRAVFHFLTESAQREAYVAQVRRAVKPGGHVLLATFAAHGPHTCSGLPVMRYTAQGLHEVFGPSFELLSHSGEDHRTPAGAVQSFVYAHMQRLAGSN